MNSEPAQSLSIVSGPSLERRAGARGAHAAGLSARSDGDVRRRARRLLSAQLMASRAGRTPSCGSGRSKWRVRLRACGVGKDARVGVLMTNRPEWIAALFGISLAGGVAVTLSTFSTPAELEYLLQRLRRFGAVVRAGRC